MGDISINAVLNAPTITQPNGNDISINWTVNATTIQLNGTIEPTYSNQPDFTGKIGDIIWGTPNYLLPLGNVPMSRNAEASLIFNLTMPSSGMYLLYANLCIGNVILNNGDIISGTIRLNDKSPPLQNFYASGPSTNAFISFPIYLASGDTLGVFGRWGDTDNSSTGESTNTWVYAVNAPLHDRYAQSFFNVVRLA